MGILYCGFTMAEETQGQLAMEKKANDAWSSVRCVRRREMH